MMGRSRLHRVSPVLVSLQTQQGHDTAGVRRLQGLPFVGVHPEDAGHFFRDALDRIVDLLARFQRAGVEAHIGEALALVHHDLKGQGGQGAVVPGRPGLLGAGLGVLADDGRHFRGVGQEVLDAVQQGLDPFVAQGGAAVGGHALEGQGGAVQTGLELLRRQLPLGQVGLHDLVVHFGQGLHQGLPGRGRGGFEVLRNLHFVEEYPQGLFPPLQGLAWIAGR